MTLCCTKMLESAAHADSDPHIAAVKRLVSLDPILPVHCVLAGEEDGFVSVFAFTVTVKLLFILLLTALGMRTIRSVRLGR